MPSPAHDAAGLRLGFVVGLAAEARIAARFGVPVEAGGGTPEGAARAATRLIEKGVTALVSFGLAGGLDPALRPGELIVPSGVVVAPAHIQHSEKHTCDLAGPEAFGVERGRNNDSRGGRDRNQWNADPDLAALFGGLTPHAIFAGSEIVAEAASKRRIHIETNTHAVDLESGAVASVAAAHGLPFVVVRAICDPAERNLPPAALVALDAKGSIGLAGILRSVLRHPRQIPDLLALARDAAAARRALIQVAERFQAEVKRSSR